MTIIELLVVLVVVGIISSMGIPAFQKMLERHRLKEAAESFKSDVLFARTEALKQSRNVAISRTSGNNGAWCYGLRANDASCDCAQTTTSATDYCDLKRVLGADFNQTNLDAGGTNNNQVDFRRGTIANNGVTFSTANYSARVVFSQVGRVRICTPTGTLGLPEFPDC